MDRYDPALIFDLAAGLLPDEEARAAEAALSPEGKAELAAQRAVLAAIADQPAVHMTDIERARMHRAVAAGIADATREMPAVAAVAQPTQAPVRRRTTIWMRFASAAAVAALFVGVVAVGSQLVSSDGAGDSADTIVRSDNTEALATTAGGADLTTTTAQASDGAQNDAALEDSLDGGDAPRESSPIEDEELSMLAEAPPLAALPGESDLGVLEDFALEMLTSDRFGGDLSSLPCYQVAVEDDDLEIAASFRVPYPGDDGEERFAIAFSDAGTATSDSLVRLYDPATCEPLADTTETP